MNIAYSQPSFHFEMFISGQRISVLVLDMIRIALSAYALFSAWENVQTFTSGGI